MKGDSAEITVYMVVGVIVVITSLMVALQSSFFATSAVQADSDEGEVRQLADTVGSYCQDTQIQDNPASKVPQSYRISFDGLENLDFRLGSSPGFEADFGSDEKTYEVSGNCRYVTDGFPADRDDGTDYLFVMNVEETGSGGYQIRLEAQNT